MPGKPKITSPPTNSKGEPFDFWRFPAVIAPNKLKYKSERFKSFTNEELTKRDKVNLDTFWLKDDALEESATPRPGNHCAGDHGRLGGRA
jgi:hypothetical protein